MANFVAFVVIVILCAVVFHLFTRRDDHHNTGLMLAIYGAAVMIVTVTVYEALCWLLNHVDIVLKLGG